MHAQSVLNTLPSELKSTPQNIRKNGTTFIFWVIVYCSREGKARLSYCYITQTNSYLEQEK
jgi:hypothetical protein